MKTRVGKAFGLRSDFYHHKYLPTVPSSSDIFFGVTILFLLISSATIIISGFRTPNGCGRSEKISWDSSCGSATPKFEVAASKFIASSVNV